MEQDRTAWRPEQSERSQVGLVLFEDDPVSAPTLQHLLDPMGIDVQSARMAFPRPHEDATAFAARLGVAAATILPSTPPAAIGFACTTGAIQIGLDGLRRAMRRPGVEIEPITPIDGVIAALHRLDVRRLAIVSPYAKAISSQVVMHIEQCGFSVSRLSYFNASNEDITAISAESILAAARHACKDEHVEAVFLSCTGMRAVPVIAGLEADLGIPVLTSLQLMAWRIACVLGIRPSGPGRLFSQGPLTPRFRDEPESAITGDAKQPAAPNDNVYVNIRDI